MASGHRGSPSAPSPKRPANNFLLTQEEFRSVTPNTAKSFISRRRPSYGTLQPAREVCYNLDYPEDKNELAALQLDPNSRFYARNRPRSLDLPSLLPYETETPRELARFLAHIVAHLYIAIKSLDIQGVLSVSAKDLAALRELLGISDIDMALETSIFELASTKDNPMEGSTEALEGEDLDIAEENDENDEPSDQEDLDDFGGNYAEEDSDSEGEAEDREDNYDIMETGESATQHRRCPKSAAGVSVRVWTQELLVWLKMKYEMPVSLRVSLAKVYYAICCCRGQHLNIKVYAKIFDILTKNVELMRIGHLQLPWEPIYDEVRAHFPLADSMQESFEKKDLGLVLKLAERASNFFAPDSLPILFQKLASQFTIPNAAVVLWSMRLLPQNFVSDYGKGLNDSLDIRHYILPLVYMWKKLSKSSGVDTHLTSALGRVAMCYLSHLNKNGKEIENSDDSINFGKFGVFSEDQFLYMINSLLNSLSINSPKFGSMKSKFFHGFASAIVFSINGNRALEPDGVLIHIQNLFNAIESFVHPSNSGDWSKPISKFILSIVYQFHKRYNMERQKDGGLYNIPTSAKLSDEVVLKFVKFTLGIVRIGLQSKRNSVMEQYLVAIEFLAHLDANQTLSHVLPDIYESLDGVISTHRVVTAMRCMEQLVRYFASTPCFRVHLPRILSLLLPGLDSNDLLKTTHAFNIFAASSNYVPIFDLTNGEGDPGLAMEFTNMQLEFLERKLIGINGPESSVVNDQEYFEVEASLEIDALKSASASFKYLMKSFAQRIFTLLENIPDPSKSDGIEKEVCETLPKLLFMILEAMSDDIFYLFRAEFECFIFDTVIHSIADEVGEIFGGITKRDPVHFKEFAPLLIARIREEISENGAGKGRSGSDIIPRDQALFWYLLILNECVGNAGEYIVDLGDELNSLSLFLMKNVKGRVGFSTTHLLNQMLQGATETRLKESRLINASYLLHLTVDEKCWGGFQFDEYRFSQENLTFDWFIPTSREVKFAIQTFKSHITLAVSNILKTLKEVVRQKSEKVVNGEKPEKSNDKSMLDISDELRPSFLYLGFGLSGISYLLDPSFEEDIPKLSNSKIEPIGDRLRLLEQIRGMKSKKILLRDDTGDNAHESLEQIVKDIELSDVVPISNGENSIADQSKNVGIDSMEDIRIHADSQVGSKESLENATNISHRNDLQALRMTDLPSGFSLTPHSPKLMEIDSVNPGITFRERKLYTSRYFFGDDIETRRANDMYLEVHRLRHLVGKSLHHICKFMLTHLSDDTKLFKHLLYALNVWFNDVGKERNLNHCHARIPYSYNNELQQINRIRKPFSRITFGSRLESYHMFRSSLHAASRSMSEMDKLLIQDVTRLSCSTYYAISDPAHSTLVDVMKRVNGSYGVIVRSTLRHLSKAIQKQQYRQVESALGIFQLKKISLKLHGDYMVLRRFMELLQQCLSIDDTDVSDLAQGIYKDLCTAVYPPRNFCLIKHTLVDSIRPPDQYIDLEVQVVNLAKEKKRKLYLSKIAKIQNAVISHEKNNSHWKISYYNLLFLIELQLEYELETNSEVFKLVTSALTSDHPLICKLAVKSMAKLFNKLRVLSIYNYDMDKAYNPSYLTKDQKLVDTRPVNGKSFLESWTAEVSSPQPSYYWDNKFSNGWLFWDDNMVMVNRDTQKPLVLKDRENDILNAFGKNVTKEWIQDIVRVWIDDNEANSAFQGLDVSFMTGIVMLLSDGFITNLSFQDILDIISDIYDPEDKSCHIVVCEMISGILVGTRYMKPDWVVLCDNFIVNFLQKLLSRDITPETRHVWNILFWYVPAHVDSRRFPHILETLLEFPINVESDSAVMEATILSYIRSMSSAISWGLPGTDQILEVCFRNFGNKYQAIRDQVGSLLAVASFTFYGDSYRNVDDFIAACSDHEEMRIRCANASFYGRLLKVFERIESHRLVVKNMLTQDILQSEYIYYATTMLSFLKQALNTSIAVQFQNMVSTVIVPFLLNLIAMKEVCLLGSIDPYAVFKQASQIMFEPIALEEVIKMLELYSTKDLLLLQYYAMGEFVEVVYFKNIFTLTSDQRKRILNIVNSMIFHKSVEIREALANTFSGLIHATPPTEIEGIIDLYRKRYSSDLECMRKKYKKSELKNISQQDTIILHGATLGLGSLVHAFSLTSPPPKWIPQILTILSNNATGIPGIIGKSAKETLGKFKKTRQDSWHIDSKVFSEDQMQALEGVLWKSYFI